MALIISDEISNEAIWIELGRRLRETRLNVLLTQEVVAGEAGLAVNTVKNLEKGKGTLASVVAVMRALDALDQLNSLLPAPGISPLMMLKKSKPRQRARGKKNG